MLLLIRCLLSFPLWDSVIVLYMLCYFMSILVLQSHSDGEERASCFAYCVFLVSGDCCVALPRIAVCLPAVCACNISGLYWKVKMVNKVVFYSLFQAGIHKFMIVCYFVHQCVIVYLKI